MEMELFSWIYKNSTRFFSLNEETQNNGISSINDKNVRVIISKRITSQYINADNN
jgi:hypothetical protein